MPNNDNFTFFPAIDIDYINNEEFKLSFSETDKKFNFHRSIGL